MSAPGDARREGWFALEQDLRAFELEEWGTNRMEEIREKIQADEWSKAQARMTGMDEEQADWDADE
jgi:hypothetical protein